MSDDRKFADPDIQRAWGEYRRAHTVPAGDEQPAPQCSRAEWQGNPLRPARPATDIPRVQQLKERLAEAERVAQAERERADEAEARAAKHYARARRAERDLDALKGDRLGLGLVWFAIGFITMGFWQVAFHVGAAIARAALGG